MSDTQPRSNAPLNAVLSFLALAWIALIIVLVARDLRTHNRRAEDAAAQAAARALAPVKDTAAGWFPAHRDPIFDWEDGEQGWRLEDDDPTALTPGTEEGWPEAEAVPRDPASAEHPSKSLSVAESGDAAHGKALAVPVQFPDPATVFRDNAGAADKFRMQGVRFIAYDVFVPKDCTGFVGCLFFLKDKDGLWYQARSRTPLLAGRWTTVAADIRGESPDVTPLGHLGQWDENQATRVRTIGITFYGDKPYKGTLLIDNLRGWLRPQRFQQMLAHVGGRGPVAPERLEELQKLAEKAHAYKDDAIKLLNFRSDPPPPPAALGQKDSSPPLVRKFETLTLRFELNRQVDNPFDPEKADIACMVETPGGAKLEHIGFWYQDYDRADRFAGDELLPLGRPEWRVRITPREEGEHKYTLRVKLKDEVLQLPARAFMCLPSEHKGFVRVSEKDRRWFEFENGQFFYPIGHNLHSPVDIRCWREVFHEDPPAGRGLPMYAEFFDKMQKHGENTAEVWMSSWWLAIEWTSKWRNFYGPGRYSLQNAWKLDYLLQLARERGINVHLVLDNHGKFSAWCDWEWDLNPYNNACDAAGVVNSAQDFFTNETARRWHRNRLRYVAARWSCDPTIMGWELVSEYDLVGGRNRQDQSARQVFHRSPILQNWAREMIGYLRQCDVYKRPVTNHYATDYNWIDAQLARTPVFDYIVTDAYRPDRGYAGAAARMQTWMTNFMVRQDAQKPFWITEFGGDWNATVPAALEADAHCGLWATWMTEGAATPLFWWYDFIDRNNLYTYYRAFANYARGEDRRGIQGACEILSITAGNAASQLTSGVYRWETGAYGWVYDIQAMEQMPPAAQRIQREGVRAELGGLAAGKYRIEYWDCYQGRIIKSDKVDLPAGHALELAFPTFTNNIAFKIKKGE